MNSDSRASSSVLSGASNLSPTFHSLGFTPQPPVVSPQTRHARNNYAQCGYSRNSCTQNDYAQHNDVHTNGMIEARSPSIVRSQGQVYSLSGSAARNTIDSSPFSSKQRISVNPCSMGVVRRSHKFNPSRSLPYQKSHQARFLCLEKDTERLMQQLASHIKQAS